MPLAPVRALPGASAESDDRDGAPTVRPHPHALQPPWFDGWYDLDETVRIVSAYLVDLAPHPYEHRPHPAMAA